MSKTVTSALTLHSSATAKRIKAPSVGNFAPRSTWPLLVIEEALGRDASMVMPAGLRSSKITVRLPAFLIQTLHILAGENGEDANALLTRELHGLAHMNRERLSHRIVEFDDCVEWPLVEYEKAS